jgi:hypothetical protein
MRATVLRGPRPKEQWEKTVRLDHDAGCRWRLYLLLENHQKGISTLGQHLNPDTMASFTAVVNASVLRQAHKPSKLMLMDHRSKHLTPSSTMLLDVEPAQEHR